MDVRSAAPTPPPSLVGRDRELALLHDRLTAARDGRGSLVLIGGEAGIGKTALADGLCREAADRGAHVLSGHCCDRTATPAHGRWIKLSARSRSVTTSLRSDEARSRRGAGRVSGAIG
jgi:predicted ATPase